MSKGCDPRVAILASSVASMLLSNTELYPRLWIIFMPLLFEDASFGVCNMYALTFFVDRRFVSRGTKYVEWKYFCRIQTLEGPITGNFQR